MAKIKTIEASEILNAKGFPTIEAMVMLSDGNIGTASCPSGEKISHYEAADLKDDVTKTIANIKNVIAPQLIGKEVEHQVELDKIMIDLDGTQNKSRLGANAIFTVSMAIAKAGADSSSLPLFMYLKQFLKKDHGELRIPTPIFDFINGKIKENHSADFSEFLLIPASSKPYLECIQIDEVIRKSLKQVLETKYAKSIGDYEEDFAPDLTTNKEAFSLIKQATENTSVKLGLDVFFGLNSRASNFYKNEKYYIKDNPSGLSSRDLINYYDQLNNEFHLLYIEDPLDQDDWNGWVALFGKMSNSTIISGGDLISTNPYRLQMAIDKKAVSGIVIKPNQIGTVIESLAIAEAAKETGLKITVSHRTSETNDNFISDFAVAVSADYIKIGSIARGENIAKYNRLLQIENQLKIL
jgi:enolase